MTSQPAARRCRENCDERLDYCNSEDWIRLDQMEINEIPDSAAEAASSSPLPLSSRTERRAPFDSGSESTDLRFNSSCRLLDLSCLCKKQEPCKVLHYYSRLTVVNVFASKEAYSIKVMR